MKKITVKGYELKIDYPKFVKAYIDNYDEVPTKKDIKKVIKDQIKEEEADHGCLILYSGCSFWEEFGVTWG